MRVHKMQLVILRNFTTKPVATRKRFILDLIYDRGCSVIYNLLTGYAGCYQGWDESGARDTTLLEPNLGCEEWRSNRGWYIYIIIF